MPRPFNLRQARQNAAFIRLLGETGNVQLAARDCGLAKATLYSRRKVNAAFAVEWDAAMTAAQARMRGHPAAAVHAGRARGAAYKTRGGEPIVTRLADGRLQMRLARAGGVGFHASQAFLRALATCGNIAMAARAVGVAPKNVYAMRARCPAFKAEMDAARKIASERLELAVLERSDAALSGHGPDSVWMDAEPGPLPPMSTEEMLMLLNLHRRWEALGDGWMGRLEARKRRGGRWSSAEWTIERDIWFAQQKERRAAQDKREARGIARGQAYEETGNWFLPGEVVPDALREGEKG